PHPMITNVLRRRKKQARNGGSVSGAGKRTRKPANIIYGTDDVPPRLTTVVLGIQHAIESASKITMPIMLLTLAWASGPQLETMIVAQVIISGLATIAVCSRAPVVGFGRLLPSAIFSSFAAPAMMAARIGGLKLLAGMTVITAITVVIVSGVLPRWRFLF